MSNKTRKFSRRDFIKTAGAVGIGSMLGPIESITNAQESSNPSKSPLNVVPTRPFGKTGVDVSILSLGGAFHYSNLLLMKQALNMGVTYWDTAPGYGGGQSEAGIGKYFEKFPEDRKKVFLVTKADIFDPPRMTRSLNQSLESMNTSLVDLYFLHGVSYPNEADKHIKAWADKAKTQGKIRFFGFSTHSNMEDCLAGAAKLGWIDGIMLTYNFRVMHSEKMKKAVDDCYRAGIGLTAMKTQSTGWGTKRGPLNDKERALLNRFEKKGLSTGQAKLKAVWGDDRIASICAHMTNMQYLTENVSAATDSKKISDHDIEYLKDYARETASSYCAGCANLCEPTIDNKVPVSDVMRYLMYSRCYGEPGRAKSAFKEIPPEVRGRLAGLDYQDAENKCPQGMPIGRLMREAVVELA
jgi:predicted aldo/keto reductase-like oxidoreductase